MQPAIYTKRQLSIEPVKPGPCVSVIMPFDPKMCAKSKLSLQLKSAIQKLEEPLREQYPSFTSGIMLQKITAVFNSLDYSTHKKSIALYVSPGTEKVYYLDIEVEEKIIVSQAFEIKDIVLNKQREKKYLLLTIGNKKTTLFLGSNDQLKQLVTNRYDDIEEGFSDLSAPQSKNEKYAKKFIHHIDNGLNIILKAYPLPLFLVCTKETMNNFIRLSKNTDHIVEYFAGDYEETCEEQLKTVLEPYLKNWQRIKEKDLLLQLQRAGNTGKCSTGIEDVYKKANQQTGKLLIIECGYMSPAFVNEAGELKAVANPICKNGMHIKNTLDDVIEKVLENGGDVDFVSDGLLKDYGRIALIQANDSYH